MASKEERATSCEIVGCKGRPCLFRPDCGGIVRCREPASDERVLPNVSESTITSSSSSAPADGNEVESGAEATPDSHAQLEAQLPSTFESWFADSAAPGAALAVQMADGTVLEFVGGVADLKSGVALEPDGVFRIASISKSLTAATVVDLAEDGLVDLDATVVDYLGNGWVGDQPYSSEITVRQLLAHTSGLVEYAFNPAFSAEAATRYGRAWAPEDLLDFVDRQGAEFAPGSAYRYNTGGFIAAGLVIEEVTGNSAHDVMTERLFKPAGAHDIGLAPQHWLSTHHVSGYVDGGFGQLMIAVDPATNEGLVLADGTAVIDVLALDQASLRSAGWTGGGVEATMASTAAVWHAMFDGTILGPDVLAEMANAPTSAPYGLGIRLGSVGDSAVYSHTGGTAGFRSEAGSVTGVDASFAMSATMSAGGHNIDSLASQIVEILADQG